jgi:hypothetical protein
MVEGDNPGLIKEQSQGSHQVSRKVDEGQRINEIRRKSDTLVSITLDVEVQKELAAIVTGVLPFLDDPINYEQNIDHVEYALQALSSKPANLDFAKQVRQQIYGNLWRNSDRFIKILLLGTGNPAFTQILGSLFTTVIWSAVAAIFFDNRSAWAISASAFGSLVSLITALSEGTLVSREDLPTSILTGFMRICIGVAFGMVVYMVLAGEVISFIKISDEAKGKYIVAAFCFAAGFSERLGRDLLDQLGKKLIG